MQNPRYFAIIPAAGIGQRMGASIPKQYLPLAGKTVIEHTLYCLLNSDRISSVIIVLNQNDNFWPRLNFGHTKLMTAIGGKERCHSVLNGLHALAGQADPNDWVLVHDAVRPCLQPSDINQFVQNIADDPIGGLLGIPAQDTMKQVDNKQRVVKTLDRSQLWQAQTPQMFRYGKLHASLEAAIHSNTLPTDEASAIELTGVSPLLVEGQRSNIKITRKEDLEYAEFILTHRLKN